MNYSIGFYLHFQFLSRLGVPEKWHVVDVISLDKDMLGMIPRPTLAMILLFPTSEKVMIYIISYFQMNCYFYFRNLDMLEV